MGLPRLRFLRRDLALDYGPGVATPKDARRALQRALRDNARRAQRGDERPDLCLIGQAHSGEDYPSLRSHWMRRARGWSVERWPARLPQDRYALFVAPVSPDVASRPRHHPRPEAEPVFVDFDLALDPTDALAIGVAVWLEQVAAPQLGAVALAPPVLDRHSGGRLSSRQVCDFGLEWNIASPLVD